MRPQPPGAAALAAASALGETVRKSTFGHWMVSQLSSTRPPVSLELAFQHLQPHTADDCRCCLDSSVSLAALPLD